MLSSDGIHVIEVQPRSIEMGMSDRDPPEKCYTKLPKTLVSKEIVETATVGYMLLSIQKYPVKEECKIAMQRRGKRVDTNYLAVESASLNSPGRVLHGLEN